MRVLTACLLLISTGWAAEAQTGSGPTSRLEIRGALVYDRKTQLLWQRCSVGQQWAKGHCIGQAKRYRWDEAREVGTGGWRLPTGPELRSLVDQNRKAQKLKPFLDVTAFPDVPEILENDRPFGRFFWSSTARQNCIDSTHMGCADYVEFDTDLGDNGWTTMSRSYRFLVRLVRLEPQTPSAAEATPPSTSTASREARFVIAGNEALDRQTGLTWQRCDAGRPFGGENLGCLGVPQLYTLAEAQHLVRDGWRLPTREELQTLLDKRHSSLKPHLDATVFLDVDEHYDLYWTSTPYDNPKNNQVYCIWFSMSSITNCSTLTSQVHARLVRRGP